MFRGVNRHEWNPHRGRAVTWADMVADVMLMKANNVNAVRTAHYPPNPRFFDLCDAHGLYCVDEADHETHGMMHAGGGWAALADDPAWAAAHVDRARRMVARDFNHPSILIWSLGNEFGHGDNTRAMAAQVRSMDPTRLIQAEPDRRLDSADVLARCTRRPRRSGGWPAAGTTTGARTSAATSSTPRRSGACPSTSASTPTQWATGRAGSPTRGSSSRAPTTFTAASCGSGATTASPSAPTASRTRRPSGRSATPTAATSGSSPTTATSSPDGLVFSDHSPSPGLLEHKHAVAPIEIKMAGNADDGGGHRFGITNKHDHRDASHLRFRWSREGGGEGTLDPGPLPAGASATVAVPGDDGGVVTLRAELAEATAWAPAGHELAFGQSIRSAGLTPEPLGEPVAWSAGPEPTHRGRRGFPLGDRRGPRRRPAARPGQR